MEFAPSAQATRNFGTFTAGRCRFHLRALDGTFDERKSVDVSIGGETIRKTSGVNYEPTPAQIPVGQTQPDVTFVSGPALVALGAALWASPADPIFAAARNGAAPFVAAPWPTWLNPGGTPPLWISTRIDANQQGVPPASALFAINFNVTTAVVRSAYLHLCWSADDRIGDGPSGPNPVGVYVNGYPVSAAFTGGSLSTYTCMDSGNLNATTPVVHAGVDSYVYLYNRDLAAVVSGVRYDATIIVSPCASGNAVGVPALSEWGLLIVVLLLGTAAAFLIRRRSSAPV